MTGKFKQLVLRMKSLVHNYRTAVLEPAGKTKHVEYAIRKGVWKFNQYYDLRPGKKKEYADFIMTEYIRALEEAGLYRHHGGVERGARRRGARS